MSTLIEIDHRGDMTLTVPSSEPTTPIAFKACSRTLSRSSPVFDKMLYGTFSEANPQSHADWTITLNNEKAQPMEIFLHISHASFDKVPKVLSVETLYDLTVLTNYWDATALLAPWVPRWMASVDDIARDANVLMPKMLWISWELCHKKTFQITADRLLMEYEGPWSELTSQLIDIQTPPDILERVQTIRIQTFTSLLSIFQTMVQTLIVVDEQPRWCHHATYMGPHRCESMILGSMTFCLARASLWPLPDAESSSSYSIVGLYRKLTSLIIHDIGAEVMGKPTVDHKACNPGPYLLEQVKNVMDGIPNPLTDFHVQHFQKQAKNT